MKNLKSTKSRVILSLTFILVLIGGLIPAAASVFSSRHSALADSSGWTVVPSPTSAYNSLLGVRAISASDAWAVGFDASNGGYRTLIMHWDGTSWSKVITNTVGHLSSVAAVSSNDVWAVGTGSSGTLTMHWNGSSWSMVPSPNSGVQTNTLNSVAAVSSNDVWAVGYYYPDNSSPENTLIIHWDGSSWSMVPSPSGILSSVTAISSSDAWAVGYGYDVTITMHWDGTSWTTVPSPNPSNPFYNVLESVAEVSSNDVWAVGYGYDVTITMHWDGTSWTTVPSPNPSSSYNVLDSVATVSSNDVWAVGYDGNGALIEHYVASTPTPSLSVNVTVSTPGGHFISSDLSNYAALPLHIHVVYTDGSPVAGAKVHLSNPNGF